jgi:hypothetical protein
MLITDRHTSTHLNRLSNGLELLGHHVPIGYIQVDDPCNRLMIIPFSECSKGDPYTCVKRKGINFARLAARPRKASSGSKGTKQWRQDMRDLLTKIRESTSSGQVDKKGDNDAR